MKQLMTVLALSAACLSGSAFAADRPMMGKQQTRMAECNRDAGDRRGDDRKGFMRHCLTNKKVAQQERMKACNADPKARTLRGDQRKGFMRECLSA